MVAEQFAEFAIEMRGILGRILDQFNPLLLFDVEPGLAEEIRGLHDGLERVTEIVRERAQA